MSSAYGIAGQLQFTEPNKTTHSLLTQEKFVPKVGLEWTQLKFGDNNKRFETVDFLFDMVNPKTARLIMTDGASQRFTIPELVLNNPDTDKNMRLDMMGFEFEQATGGKKGPFAFTFRDVLDPSNVLLTTKNQNLIMSDKYIQMDIQLPTRRQYGFGERYHGFELGEGAWGMWSDGFNGQSTLDTGLGRGGQYGVHPFILVQTKKTQKYVGIYFRNANAQTPIIQFQNNTEETILSYITLGGMLEVYFFSQGSAKQVISQYQSLFGKPQLPPFWSLGWQESSFKGHNDEAIYQVQKNYTDAGFPLEAVYLDIQSNDNLQNFALNKTFFSNLTALSVALRAKNQRLIAFVDPTIYLPEKVTLNETTNKYYVAGNQSAAFIKTSHFRNDTGIYSNNLVGHHSQKRCVYIDWFNFDQTPQFWQSALKEYSEAVPFDGLWTSSNEPFNSDQGEFNIYQANSKQNDQNHERVMTLMDTNTDQSYYDNKWYTLNNVTNRSLYYLPFIPQFKERGSYDQYSVSLNATHESYDFFNLQTNKWEKTIEFEYNLHSLYGHAMMYTTYNALTSIASNNKTSHLHDKRLFVLTRSTFTSTNRYASYAVRSKYRTWEALRYAIPHLMNMNMFGFVHSGADACGSNEYNQDVTQLNEELCLRWIQMSTFFPLARHTQDYTDSHSYVTGPLGFQNADNIKLVKSAMLDRMRYLRFMYTCMFEASQNGGTCIDPIFFHYPTDGNNEQVGMNDTFIFGSAVKVSPVVYAKTGDQTKFRTYFPKGKWVSLADYSKIVDSTGGFIELDMNQQTVNAHLRPGSIIPIQQVDEKTTRTTADLITKPTSILINRDAERSVSEGTVFLDGGESLSELTGSKYEYYQIQHKASKSIQFQLKLGTRGSQDSRHFLESIVIANAEDLSETDFACVFENDGSIQMLNHTYSQEMKTLGFQAFKLDQKVLFSQISTILYGNSKKDLNLCMMKGYEYYIPETENLTQTLNSTNGSFILKHSQNVLPDLRVTIRMFDRELINVKWTWANDSTVIGKRAHFEVPDEIANTSRSLPFGAKLGQYITIQRNPFQMNFTQNVGTQEPAFLKLSNLVYDSYLNWVGLHAVTQKGDNFRGVMGLGERSMADSLFFKDGVYSMWAMDQFTSKEDGQLPGKQTYGVHPFFMYQHTQDHWVGVFMKQAQAHDWIIQNDPIQGHVHLKQIATGGVGDMYVMFLSQKPESVLASYQKIIGKPALMPQWSLGWHQCKWCLRNVTEYQQVVEGYRNNKIPLDGQWADIDYMENYKDFTVDYANFGNLTKYVNELFHNESMNIKFVPILDAGIAARGMKGYSSYDKGVEMDVFLKQKSGQTFIGQVWPNEAAFPDFFHPNTSKWWSNELSEFQTTKVWFDGLWLDMNEAANFCNGNCDETLKQLPSEADNFIYTPTGRDLQTKSLPLDLKHYNGMTQLDAHSYYGTQMTKASYDWFVQNSTKRPFIVERSSFAGLGKYAGKWLGDSHSTYEDMQRTVSGVMMMGVFGIPFAGGDICGFAGQNSDAHLCARWHQVGAFQPFSRNHRDCNGRQQEPYQFLSEKVGNTNVTVTDVMRDAILKKYSLHRYYYTHMFLMSRNPQYSTFYKPLFFEFPNDPAAYQATLSENVMLGPSLKLSIKTSPLKDVITDTNTYYFPEGNWCDIFDRNTSCIVQPINMTGGSIQMLPAGLQDFQVHLRSGHIVVMQDAYKIMPNTSEDMKKAPVDLHIHPQKITETQRNRNYQAKGVYVNDDGKNATIDGNYNEYQISFTYRDQINSTILDENIYITVGLVNNASNYYSNETKCSAVDQSDYLGSIYINAEEGEFQSAQYAVGLLRPDQTYEDLGVAVFDPNRNSYIYEPASEAAKNVYLGYIQEIRLTPVTE